MILLTEYSATPEQLKYLQSICGGENKMVLNKPTGDFFYDSWEVLPEYKDTPVEDFLNQFNDIGEARIIRQESGTCYFSHSDIDDRYHLNLSGDCSALIDITNNKNYFLKTDMLVYIMDAGKTHSAANFGEHTRYQLVIRKLLNKVDWVETTVEIHAGGNNPRFAFDKHVSPVLNEMNKRRIISNFEILETGVRFKTNDVWFNKLKDTVPTDFTCITV